MKPLPFLLFEALLLCLLGSPPRVVRVSSLKALLEGLLLLLVLHLQPGLQLLDALRCHCVTPFFAHLRHVLIHRLRCCSMASASHRFIFSRSSFGRGCSPLARASASSDSSAASSSSSERRASASLVGWSSLLFLLASMDSSRRFRLPICYLLPAAVPGPQCGPQAPVAPLPSALLRWPVNRRLGPGWRRPPRPYQLRRRARRLR